MIFMYFQRTLFAASVAGALLAAGSVAADNPAIPFATQPPASVAAAPDERRLIELGPGDQISLEVYGQPDMNSTLYVSNDGTISVPLAGPVQVGGLTPVVAAK